MNLNLVLAQLLLSAMGLLGVAASAPDLVFKHGGQILLGLVFTLLVAHIRPKGLLKIAPLVWGGCLALLVLVLFIGQGGNNSPVKRWIDLGPVDMQPSEFAKLGLVLMLGSLFARKGVDAKLFGSAAIIGITSLLVVVEPDLGTTVLIFASGIFMMFMAGVRILNIGKLLVALSLLALPVIGVVADRNPYLWDRVTKHTSGTSLDGKYQVFRAKTAMEQGGLWGLGTDEKIVALPADHTDMIVASIGHAAGFLGILIVFLGFWLVVHSSVIAIELLLRRGPLTPELHGACVIAAGAMFVIVSQAAVNLCVAIGLVPVTGVPLPLVSYGGSSGLAMGIAFGLIHSALRALRYIEVRDVPAVAARAEALALPLAQPAQVLPRPAAHIVLALDPLDPPPEALEDAPEEGPRREEVVREEVWLDDGEDWTLPRPPGQPGRISPLN